MLRKNSVDTTIERNYIQKWRFMIKEYELVKSGKHPSFRFVKQFYDFHNTNRQTFLKYYNRYLNQGDSSALLPKKRGPKYKARLRFIENQVIKQREKGLNRYEIFAILSPVMKHNTPSASQIYRICKKYNLNKLKPKMKQEKRIIIKQKAGELAHVDCHHLSRDLLLNNDKKRYYLFGIIDSCTRLAWAEVVEDITSLSVMFATLKSLNILKSQYNIEFKEILSDNGGEFGSGKNAKNKDRNPFERLLLEMGIKHRYTKPYRPQTNGKIERFWRTLNDDLIDGTNFDDINEFRQELHDYMFYYNEHRLHSSLKQQTPKNFNISVNELAN